MIDPLDPSLISLNEARRLPVLAYDGKPASRASVHRLVARGKRRRADGAIVRLDAIFSPLGGLKTTPAAVAAFVRALNAPGGQPAAATASAPLDVRAELLRITGKRRGPREFVGTEVDR